MAAKLSANGTQAGTLETTGHTIILEAK